LVSLTGAPKKGAASGLEAQAAPACAMHPADDGRLLRRDGRRCKQRHLKELGQLLAASGGGRRGAAQPSLASSLARRLPLDWPSRDGCASPPRLSGTRERRRLCASARGVSPTSPAS